MSDLNRERLVDEFMKMVRISSVTLNEGNFAAYLKSKLLDLGFEVHVDNAGKATGSNTGNIISRLPGSKDVSPVLFCAHMDTVVPGEDIKPQLKDGIIQSDGTTILGSDDKAGIAAILEAVRFIQENNIPHGEIEIAFTICEEGGLFGAKNLDYSRIKSKTAFVLDSGEDVGCVIVQAPAQDKLFITIEGRAAHAGIAPEQGINAIQVASRAINNMKLLRIDEETTANVGTINGGSTTNIVCDRVDLSFEARSRNTEKLEAQVIHMIDCIEKACAEFGAVSHIERVHNYTSFSIDSQAEILKITAAAMQRIGTQMITTPTGGGSDTNIINGKGIETVTLAIGMKKVHTTSEYIAVESLIDTARLVAAIIQEIK